MSATTKHEDLVRATGLLVLEVVTSYPNGDPDNESDHANEQRWAISARFRRSLGSSASLMRDLVEGKDGPVWQDITAQFKPALNAGEFDILEKRGRDRANIQAEIKAGTFTERYWDGRIFGNTFLEKREAGSDSIKRA